MKRIILPVGMLLMGIALVGGAAQTLIGSLASLDEQIGTHGSAAAAVLGVGLIVAAVNPSAHLGWVRAGILYGLVVLVFEVGSWLVFRKTFHLGPVIFGLAFSLLLIATYPEREKLLPAAAEMGPKKTGVTPPTPSAINTPPVDETESEPEA